MSFSNVPFSTDEDRQTYIQISCGNPEDILHFLLSKFILTHGSEQPHLDLATHSQVQQILDCSFYFSIFPDQFLFWMLSRKNK